jgi:hypothetical protein
MSTVAAMARPPPDRGDGKPACEDRGHASCRKVDAILSLPQPVPILVLGGLGMNNNGTGLVLASLALADHPKVMIPVILYNLVQYVFAGYVHLTKYRDLSCRAGPEGG